MTRPTTAERFWRQVDRGGDCWLWTGHSEKGYGRFGGALAHRIAYQMFIGAIPAGLELDHTCETPLCVRPDHLEPVTRQENMRRRYARYDTCVNGHPYDEANTYVMPSGHRDCRACIRDRVRRYRLRRAS